jgi:hypothetical protein
MKVTHYHVSGPSPGVCKQSAVWVRGEDDAYWPLIYLQRPKWITDDSVWNRIVACVRVNLPRNMEVK